MFRFEMSRAGSVTERVKQRERGGGEKTKPGKWTKDIFSSQDYSRTQDKKSSQNGVRQKTRAT